MMSSERNTLKPYPIQAVHIGPRELFIKANKPPDVTLGLDESDCEMSVGNSAYNSETKRIEIAIKLEAPRAIERTSEEGTISEDDSPFELRIEMVGIFEVDDSIFPIDRIYEWSKHNALFIMYPYLKEHVFALTARAGFRPILLPLVEVPLFRMTQPEPELSVGPSQ